MPTLALLGFLILCLAFSWTTRDTLSYISLKAQHEGDGGAAGRNRIDPPVDLRPWQTAQAAAALASTAEEAECAREAERFADHEVDQAFASALRQADIRRRSPLTGEALTLSHRIERLQQLVQEDHLRVESLTPAANVLASRVTHAAAPVTGVADLEIAKAQLGLDSDQLADAQQDLARAGGDERSRIQQELSAHEFAMREYDAQGRTKSQVAAFSVQRYGSVAAQLKAWIDQNTRYQLIQQAMQQAQTDAVALTAQHNQLESQQNAAASYKNSGNSHANTTSGRATDNVATLAALNNRTAQSQLLSIYDDRIQNERQLAAVYLRWSAQLFLEHRILLHLMLQSLALIAFILICAILFDAIVRHLIERPTLDWRRMQTLRVVLRVGIQFPGVLLLLLVIFGAPSQMPTILGLTTAGLTVVLQDFIIAFLGWFVLLGKNGIRIGDWVEINGVGGEVVEIGIFRTAMLETGNWTGQGHPTGRRITFINSFAIKGQFFNFSTTGQWMWDEIRLSIPAADDAYDIIELIQKAVLRETEKDSRLAEEEWTRVTKRNGLSQFAPGPTVNMRPGASGIDIIVRYVTRASDRFQARNRLYQAVVAMLHKPLTPRLEPDLPQPSGPPQPKALMIT